MGVDVNVHNMMFQTQVNNASDIVGDAEFFWLTMQASLRMTPIVFVNTRLAQNHSKFLEAIFTV